MFLVQLACHALQTSGASEHLPEPTPEEPWRLLGEHTPDEWREMIRGIVPYYAQKYPNDEPWCLTTDDLSKPAFMQCPVPKELWKKEYKNKYSYPDDLDLLITSKNFDVKTGMLHNPQTEDWFFVLVSLQTNCGYGGAGYYGCARQNGGSATRAIFTLQYASSPGSRWGRDARVILENYDNEEYRSISMSTLFCPDKQGKRLLWLEPWDGHSSYQLSELHPLFIEISRRVRAVRSDDKVLFTQATSKCARIDNDKDHTGGFLGDPWEPCEVSRKGIKAFSSAPRYANVAKILADTETYRKPLLLHWHEGIDPETGMSLWYSMLMKGQCVTDGYSERTIPVDVQNMLDIETLSEASSAMIESAGTARTKVLAVALALYLQCGNEGEKAKRGEIDWNASVVKIWLPAIQEQMEREIDAAFFPYLWRTCARMKETGDDLDNSVATAEWKNYLAGLVYKYYQRGIESLPCRAAQRIKAQAVSEMRLRKLIKRHLAAEED